MNGFNTQQQLLPKPKSKKLLIVLIVVVLSLAVLWLASSFIDESPERNETGLSTNDAALEQELQGFDATGLDAELGSIEKEL